jgi:hypothetical protein
VNTSSNNTQPTPVNTSSNNTQPATVNTATSNHKGDKNASNISVRVYFERRPGNRQNDNIKI